MWKVLRIRDYRRLWVGSLASGLGTSMLTLALPYYVFDLTGSPIATSVTFMAQTLPALVFSPMAGVFADRWDRRRTMIAVDLLRAAILPAMLIVRHPSELWVIYLVLVIETTSAQLFGPSWQALLPTIVGHGEDLVAANSAASFSSGAILIAGGPAGGFLYAAFGLHVLIIVDALSYGISAAAILMTTAGKGADISATGGLRYVLTELLDGMNSVWTSRSLRGLIVVLSVFFAANGALTALLAPFVTRQLHGGAEHLGLFISALGGGYMLGAYAGTSIMARLPLQRLCAGTLTVVGIGFLGAFNSHSLTTAIPLIALAGVGGAVLSITQSTTIQHHTTSDFLGRASAFFMAAQLASSLAGESAGGPIAEIIGIVPTLNISSATVFIAAAAAVLLIPAKAAVQVRK